MRSFERDSDYPEGWPVAIKFEDTKPGSGQKAPETRAIKAKPPTKASDEQALDAANAPEMPFAKPTRPIKKVRRG